MSRAVNVAPPTRRRSFAPLHERFLSTHVASGSFFSSGAISVRSHMSICPTTSKMPSKILPEAEASSLLEEAEGVPALLKVSGVQRAALCERRRETDHTGTGTHSSPGLISPLPCSTRDSHSARVKGFVLFFSPTVFM